MQEARVQIAPSVLAADIGQLAKEVGAVEKAGADLIHVDIMDGHFVPNISFGPDVVKTIRSLTSLPLDVHLMIKPVDPFIDAFIDAGANMLSVHPESGEHLHRTLQKIKSRGVKAGVVLNPATPIEAVQYVLDNIDFVLVMTVNPGFGGQKFIASQLEKIRTLKELFKERGLNIPIEVDGGITAETAPQAIEAGADILVAGTAIFGQDEKDYAEMISALRGE